MRENNETRASLQQITDEEVVSAIRYLDPSPTGKGHEAETSTVFVICISYASLFRPWVLRQSAVGGLASGRNAKPQ
jgi:hypothetical protein